MNITQLACFPRPHRSSGRLSPVWPPKPVAAADADPGAPAFENVVDGGSARQSEGLGGLGPRGFEFAALALTRSHRRAPRPFSDADPDLNRRGRLGQITSPAGLSTTLDPYDPLGTARQQTDPNGVVTNNEAQHVTTITPR